jgi:D-lactate dehydrogenase (cytochrome)
MMNRNHLILELTKIAGAENVLHQPDELLVYEYDASFDTHTPDVVVLPRTTAQVSQIVKLAAEHHLPIVARGAGTGLAGGAIPLQGGILIVLTRMTTLPSLDFRNRRAVVEAGVINLDLVNAAATGGYTYAPDPGSGKCATIGGNINSNAGGPHCLAYGVTANHVLGLTVVLPNGDIIETGSPLADSPGYDVTGVIVGSEGTLGIVTQATTHLLRQPEAVRTLLVVFQTSVADASAAVSDIIAHGIVPTAMEMMDGMVCRAVEAAVHAGYPANAAGVLLIEMEGLADGLDETMARIEQICRRHHAAEVRHATTATERAALWTGRKSALGAMGRIAPNYYLEDGVVPRHKLPEVMAFVEATARQYNLPIGNFFHAGDGNIHPTILFDRRDPDASARARQAADDIMHACLAAGGTVSGEHGIGTEKQAYMAHLYNQDDLDAMADLKACFNPDDRLNPGKIFPKGFVRGQGSGGAGSRGVQPETHSSLITHHSSLVTHHSSLLIQLEAVVGAANVQADEQLIASPGSVEEVAALLRLAAENRVTVSPRGGGTRRWLGRPAAPAELVISLARLNQILEHYPSDLTAAFQAGCTLREANAALQRSGQMLPLDAPLSGQSTLGGIVAAGPPAAGLRRLAYGTARDMLLGIQLVRADGRIIRRGGMVVKNVAGYDMSRLQYGAMGTLGIITQLNMKLLPLPEDSAALVAGFARREQVGPVLETLLASQLQPATVALLDAAPAASLGLDETLPHWLLVRFEGRAAAVRRQLADTRGWAAGAGASAIDTWAAAALAERWPTLTDWPQLAHIEADSALLRLNVPAAAVIAELERLTGMCAAAGLSAQTLTDAGAGVIWLKLSGGNQPLADSLAALHPHLLARWPQTVVAAAAPEVKQAVRVWGAEPAASGLMRRIKAQFDPQNLLNRGVYL